MSKWRIEGLGGWRTHVAWICLNFHQEELMHIIEELCNRSVKKLDIIPE
jgi:hypothetical protein